MENILKILKDFGVEIPQEKEKDFEKKVLENYKTVSEVEKLQGKLTDAENKYTQAQHQYETDIKKRDSDLADLQGKLKNSESSVETLATLRTQLADLQKNYDTEKTEYQKKLAEQEYNFLVKEATNSLKFSSNSAKKQFIQDVTENRLTVKDGSLMGFSDFVEKYKEADAGAFLSEEAPQEKPPMFSTGSNNPTETHETEPKEIPLIF